MTHFVQPSTFHSNRNRRSSMMEKGCSANHICCLSIYQLPVLECILGEVGNVHALSVEQHGQQLGLQQ